MKTKVRSHRDRITHIENTHISHYEVECLNTNGVTAANDPKSVSRNTSASLFAGSLGNLKRLAARFGLSVVSHMTGDDGIERITYDAGGLWTNATHDGYILAVDNRRLEKVIV